MNSERKSIIGTITDIKAIPLETENNKLKETIKQQAEQIEQLHGVCSRYEAENKRLRTMITDLDFDKDNCDICEMNYDYLLSAKAELKTAQPQKGVSDCCD